jgi:hypothetical protein
LAVGKKVKRQWSSIRALKIHERDQKVLLRASTISFPRNFVFPTLRLRGRRLRVFSMEPMVSAVISLASKRPKDANQHQPGKSSPSPSSRGMSPSLSFEANEMSFALSRLRRAASDAAYTPVSRFFERKERFTLDLIDFAIVIVDCEWW